MVNEGLKHQILEELMLRLGEETWFERVATRAGVPIIVMPGHALRVRYEQIIDRLWQLGPESVASYLDAAALEAGGGFDMRRSLRRQGTGEWDSSAISTAMIRLPSPEELDRMVAGTTAATPAPAEPFSDQELTQLIALEARDRERRARSVAPPPVLELEATARVEENILSRLKGEHQGGHDASSPASSPRVPATSPGRTIGGGLRIELKDARFLAYGPPGTVGTLHLCGSGFRAPLWLELEGLVGHRSVERVRFNDGYALITELDWPSLAGRRLRVSHGGTNSDWVTVSPGDRNDAGENWPELRHDAVYVPGGEFRVPGESGIVWLERGALLALSPVTNGEFVAFVEHSGYQPEQPVDFLKHYAGRAMEGNFWSEPVLFVSQKDAEAYCTAVGGLLPSARLWERAAVGLTARRYPWGEGFDAERANSREGRRHGTTPIRTFPEGRGPYGHFDLAGNVWEWTSSHDEQTGHVILKGGAWVNDHRFLLNSSRARFRPDLRTFYLGFRVAWELPGGFFR